MNNKILIIDDTPSDIKVLSNVLHDDYGVIIATNGKDGLALVKEQHPDLILLDIIMPEMDGFAVLAALQKDATIKDIPVIFLTVVDAVDDKVKGFSGGAVDYIIKPFEPMEVKARVKVHLGLQQALKQLANQNKELQEANKLRDEVERIYQHDLKNPLTSVLGNSELLLIGNDINENVRHKAAAIHQAGLAMLNMINRCFDLFKIEQGLYNFNPQKVDFAKIIQRVLSDNEAAIKNKNLLLVLDLPKDHEQKSVRAEEMLCYTMTANLIKNAVEASEPEAPLSIHMHIQDHANGQDMLELAISNSGEVPDNVKSCFFDKYATCGKKSGMGLGTYSAKLLTELQNGTIELDTSRAGYTTIKITLPLWDTALE